MEAKDVTQERLNVSVRSDLTEAENKKLSLYLRLKGLKKGHFIREAIIEKLNRDTGR